MMEFDRDPSLNHVRVLTAADAEIYRTVRLQALHEIRGNAKANQAL
jgi:hypothetical protein